jgi:hypothetical protein
VVAPYLEETMTDDQPTGSCVCCHRRDPHEGYACTPCRSRLRSWLSEIPDLYSQLLEEQEALSTPTDTRTGPTTARGKYGTTFETTGPRDPVSYLLPGAPVGGQAKGGPVSGSRERSIPIRVDLLDLTSPHGSWLEGEDQVGNVSVWMTLQTWARDWSTFRAMGEAGDQSVPGLCHWMWERVDDMCDEHEAIDECFGDIRRLHGAMMAQLGQFDIPDYKYGVPCRNEQCNALALVRHNGSDFIECGECPSVLTPQEFDAWVRAVASAMKKEKAA